MLKAFLNAFRVPDLRAKILFTLFIIAVFRLGSHMPVPVVDIGISKRAARSIAVRAASSAHQPVLRRRRSASLRCSALGIMPYITGSIIMQLMTVVIPKLEQWQKQGESGQKKINQSTRYVTVVLALLQSTGLVFPFHNATFGMPDVFRPATFTGAARGAHRPDR